VSRYLHYLRVSFSVTCGIAAVLLCVLWVRSYDAFDTLVLGYRPGRCAVVDSVFGRIHIGFYNGPKRFGFSSMPLTGVIPWISEKSTLVVSHLILAFLSAALAPLPWLPWSNRFSLRTLLIAIMLVAVLLGVIVLLIR
jgi:hypothetical protein